MRRGETVAHEASTQPIGVELIAMLVAVADGRPLAMTIEDGRALPSGPFEVGHRSLQSGLRAWVEQQTGHPLGYVEQPYTFADSDRRAASDGARAISISYLGLTREERIVESRASWRPWYDYFPWEDHRAGAPPIIGDPIAPGLKRWVEAEGEEGARRTRAAIAFGLEGRPWNEDLVLQRYELLYEAGLIEEARRRSGDRDGPPLGNPMIGDHRRILATGIARVRAKIKYNPVVFELMPPIFTLLQLQRCVEAIAGLNVHKPNFRRLIEQQQLVEESFVMNSVAQFLKRLAQILFFLVVVVFLGSLLIGVGGLIVAFRSSAEKVEKPSILALDLDGTIVDTRDIVESLRKYRTEDHIKGVLLRINSPGGVVGPSQELWAELKRTREEFKKPVVAFCSAVAASGAYYAAVGADKIVTTPGCLIGSIGALMEFVNLAQLYDWAKIDRYAITTGKFKDAGADYRPLTSEQRALFQDLLNDVLAQFKAAIVEGRNMKPEVLDQYADGRVFTGSQAVKLGFADSVGTWDDARRTLGQMTGLGDNPEVFKVKKRNKLLEFFEASSTSGTSNVSTAIRDLFQTELSARPLLLLPGAVQF